MLLLIIQYLKQYVCYGIIVSAPLPSGEVLPYLNTLHTTDMQMKVDRRFKNQVQKSTNRIFEIIELNVDEPIIFQRGKIVFQYSKLFAGRSALGSIN